MDGIVDAARNVRRLGTVSHRDRVWTHLKEVAAQHGFTHLTVVRACLGEVKPVRLVYSDAPAAMIDTIRGSCTDMPLIGQALRQLEPFSSGQVQAMQLSPRQRQTLAHIDGTLDITDGWTFPISEGTELEGIVILAGRAPDMSPLVRSMLHVLAHFSFRKSQSLAHAPYVAEHPLTARELECLGLIALGKTDAEIGTILSIRPRTARFHIENAKRKLGVSNRVQAVAEAMRIHAIAA